MMAHQPLTVWDSKTTWLIWQTMVLPLSVSFCALANCCSGEHCNNLPFRATSPKLQQQPLRERLYLGQLPGSRLFDHLLDLRTSPFFSQQQGNLSQSQTTLQIRLSLQAA